MSRKLPKGKLSQRGFSLLAGVFLLIILSLLAVFLVAISTRQQMGSAMDVQGSRAYQAARAGIEWGSYQSLGPPNSCAGATTLTFAGTTLADFSTTVGCVRTTADELGAVINIDQITATACNQPPCPSGAPGQTYIERQLVITVAR